MDASSFPPLSLHCHLHSKLVHTCIGLAFPLAEPLGGNKGMIWDQETFLQGL